MEETNPQMSTDTKSSWGGGFGGAFGASTNRILDTDQCFVLSVGNPQYGLEGMYRMKAQV